MTTLAAKLQLKPGQTALLFGAPNRLLPLFAFPAPARSGKADAVLAFCETPEDVARLAPKTLARLKPAGLVWFFYLKGNPGKENGLTRDIGWDPLWDRGYTVVRAISLDEDWSGSRFRHESERR
jgi:hypothetical protein